MICFSFLINVIPRKQQNHTGDHAGCIDRHIYRAGITAGNEGLDGLVDAGSQKAKQKRQRLVPLQHSQQPCQANTKAGKFRKMGQLSQQSTATLRRAATREE